MNGGIRNVGWGASILLVGCFSSPPAAEETGDETESSTSTTTNVSPTSGLTMPTPPTVTDGSTTSTTTSADSGTGSSSAGSSSGLDVTSDDGTSSESTAARGCDPQRVEVDGMCLEPLAVTSAFTNGGVDAPFDEAMPCRLASCDADLPLSGGFDVANVALHSMGADFDESAWSICGASTGELSAWTAWARCAAAQGDVFVVTETHELADDEAGCLDAGCPPDTTLVGGGGRWGENFAVTGSRPTNGEHWEVCGLGFGDALQVDVDAYCAVLPEGASVDFVESIEPVDNDALGCAEAVCTSGVLIAGGGDGGLLSASFAVSRPTSTDDGWMTCGRANLASGQIRSRALCYESP